MMNKTRTYRATTHPAAPLGRRLLVLALTALLLLGAALQARAQAQAGDPPDRVARLSDASGQVWLYSPDGNEWVAVARNRPLTSGDRIATDNGARAEISLGTTTLRLDGATELEIAQLDDSNYRVHLHGGSVAARLSSPASLAEFTLETDEGQFRVQAVGRYRFDRFEQTSDLTVYAGQAVFEGRNSALPLTAGQHAQFWLDAAGVLTQPPRSRAETVFDAVETGALGMAGLAVASYHGCVGYRRWWMHRRSALWDTEWLHFVAHGPADGL